VIPAPRVRLVPVELWPYETSRAAVQGVIGTLVDALAREVNVLSVRGIPSAYAEAMTSAGGWSSAMVRLQGVPANPTETLTAIDRIATTIGLRFVLWIEDLERFAGGDHAGAGGEERLNPIRALLHGLDAAGVGERRDRHHLPADALRYREDRQVRGDDSAFA
jgi:hypothetical protein